MKENYELQLICRGTDTLVEIIPHDPNYILTAEDLEIIHEFGERTSAQTRRKVKYLLIRGHTLSAEDTDSGRHVRVKYPNRSKPIATLRKGTNSGIIVSQAQIVQVEDGTEEIIFPTKEDLRRSIVLPSI